MLVSANAQRCHYYSKAYELINAFNGLSLFLSLKYLVFDFPRFCCIETVISEDIPTLASGSGAERTHQWVQTYDKNYCTSPTIKEVNKDMCSYMY